MNKPLSYDIIRYQAFMYKAPIVEVFEQTEPRFLPQWHFEAA